MVFFMKEGKCIPWMSEFNKILVFPHFWQAECHYLLDFWAIFILTVEEGHIIAFLQRILNFSNERIRNKSSKISENLNKHYLVLDIDCSLLAILRVVHRFWWNAQNNWVGYQILVNFDFDTDTGNFTKSIRYQALQYRDSGPIPKVSPTPAAKVSFDILRSILILEVPSPRFLQ